MTDSKPQPRPRERGETMPWMDERDAYRPSLRREIERLAVFDKQKKMHKIDMSNHRRTWVPCNMLWLGPDNDISKMCEYGMLRHMDLVRKLIDG